MQFKEFERPPIPPEEEKPSEAEEKEKPLVEKKEEVEIEEREERRAEISDKEILKEPTIHEKDKEMYSSLTPEDKGFFRRLAEKVRDPLERATSYLKKKEEIIGRADKKITELENDKNVAEKMAKDANVAMRREEEAFKKAEEAFKKIFGEMAAAEKIQNLQLEVDKKKEKLETTIKESDKKCNKIEKKIGEIKEKREEYEKERNKAIEKLDNVLVNKIAGNGKEIDQHRESLEEIVKQIEKNKMEISNLEKNIQEAKSVLPVVKGTVTEKEFRKIINDLETQQEKLEKANRESATFHRQMETRVSKLEGENEKLVAKLSEDKIKELLEEKSNWNWLVRKIPEQKLNALIETGVLPKREKLVKQGFLEEKIPEVLPKKAEGSEYVEYINKNLDNYPMIKVCFGSEGFRLPEKHLSKEISKKEILSAFLSQLGENITLKFLKKERKAFINFLKNVFGWEEEVVEKEYEREIERITRRLEEEMLNAEKLAEKKEITEEEIRNKAYEIYKKRIRNEEPYKTMSDEALAKEGLRPDSPEALKFLKKWDWMQAKKELEEEEQD